MHASEADKSWENRLTPIERALVAHASTADGRTLDAPCVDAAGSRIRASVITWLLTTQAGQSHPPRVAVRIRRADIVGRLNLGGKQILYPLELTDCTLRAPVVLTKATAPNINLRGSRVPALYGNFLRVAGTLNLSGGFHCTGQTKLFKADLGELEAERGIFHNPRGYALSADYLHVRSYASFERANLRGTLRMVGARTDGQLDCTGMEITAPSGANAIELDSSTFTGGAVFSHARISGGVWLVNTTADADVAFRYATVHNPGGYAIDGSSTRLRTVDFTEATIHGEVKLTRAQLDNLDCYDAKFLAPYDASLDLDGSSIAGPFHAHFAKIEGPLDLTNTSIGVFRDTRPSWPPSARLIGASYSKVEGDEEALDPPSSPGTARLEWLKLDPVYHPQKYSALSTAYLNVGQGTLARRTSIAGEHERRIANRTGILRKLAWLWSTVLRLLVGYGYAPARAIWWLAGLIVGGALVSEWLHNIGEIKEGPGQTYNFNALRYAVAILFPVARLPEAQAFVTAGLASWLVFTLSLAGWFLAAVVVAALSGLLRRA